MIISYIVYLIISCYLQTWSEHKFVGAELHLAEESTALHTLLEAALASASPSSSPHSNLENAPPKSSPPICNFQDVSFDSPLPPPLRILSQVG